MAGSPWTAPPAERPDPALVSPERQALEEWLDFERATLLMKCEGLTADQLKQRPVPPSALSLLGLVRHMTDVERWWFVIHGTDTEVALPYPGDSDFDDVEEADAAGDLAALRGEIETARAAVREIPLDEVVPSHGHHPERVRSLRWIYVHMIEEYARHNGHADLIRERIDGTTGT